MEKIILSPPFSNIYPSLKGTTKITGTYTAEQRRGLWRVLTTLRRTENGWLNNVGLRNPGIHRAKNKENIISISSLKEGDWNYIIDVLSDFDKIKGIEFNISCPNANVSMINSEILEQANSIFDNVIIKVPHIISEDNLYKISDLGESIIHISNTFKTEQGALSGKYLICKNLKSIYNLKSKKSQQKIIGGGGIYDLDILKQYESAGADYFSISTLLINPFKTYKLIKEFYEQ